MNNELVSIEPAITEILLQRVKPLEDDYAYYVISWKEARQEDYGKRQRFKVFSCVINEEEAKKDAIAFARELREMAASGKKEKRETIDF